MVQKELDALRSLDMQVYVKTGFLYGFGRVVYFYD
jgi:hypothetical protein